MMIQNQRYRFVPPGGHPSDPIWIYGLQHYSPGQSRKVDVWRLEVPERYRASIPDVTEFDTFAALCRIIAGAYFDGDEARAQAAIRP